MKRIVIAGAGYAGISALRALRGHMRRHPEDEVLIFDRNECTTMLPSLPDIASGRLRESVVTIPIRRMIPRKAVFVNQEIEKVDLDTRVVSTASGDYPYDYLVFCPGSVTNLYGFDQHLDRVFVLDSLREAVRLREAFARFLQNGDSRNLVIAGGGFTGLEAACFLRERARRQSRELAVTVLEKTDRLLGNLPAKTGAYVETLLGELRIRVVKNSSVRTFDGSRVTLASGAVIDNAFLIWAGGSKRAIDDISGTFSALADGRLQVNEFLQLPEYENVFIAGDCAAVAKNDAYLRKAAAFSASSGRLAGRNLSKTLKGRPPRKYRPIDIGWVIPLYPSSVGKLIGVVDIRGRAGLGLHYLACVYRTRSVRDKVSYAWMALRSMAGRA